MRGRGLSVGLSLSGGAVPTRIHWTAKTNVLRETKLSWARELYKQRTFAAVGANALCLTSMPSKNTHRRIVLPIWFRLSSHRSTGSMNETEDHPQSCSHSTVCARTRVLPKAR